MNKKHIYQVLGIIGVVLAVLLAIIIYVNSKHSVVEISYSTEEIKVGQPVIITYLTKEGLNYNNVDELTVKIQHQYDGYDNYESVLTPISDGEYEMIFTPSNAGTYAINITIEDEGETYFSEEKINVE